MHRQERRHSFVYAYERGHVPALPPGRRWRGQPIPLAGPAVELYPVRRRPQCAQSTVRE